MSETPVEALIENMRGFRGRLLREQMRAWSILTVLWAVSLALLVAVFSFITGVVRALTPKLPEILGYLVFVAWLIVSVWTVIRFAVRVFDPIWRVLSAKLGARRNPFRGINVEGAATMLRKARPFGLFLRSFGDERWYIPTSR